MSDHIGMAPNRIRFGASGSGGRRARRQARWHLLRKPPAERLCAQDKHLQADPSASPAQAQRTQGGLPHARTRHPRHPELAVLSVRLGLSGWQSSFGRCFSPPLPGGAGTVVPGPHGGAGCRARSEDELFGAQWPSGGPVYHRGLDFLAGLRIDEDHAALGWREPGVPPRRQADQDRAHGAPEVGQHS
jgi:hypothetical protein